MAGVILSELLLGLPTAMVADAQPGTAAVQYADLYADCYGVPRELVHAVIEVESGWQPAAVSSKGAAGIMQLMPATAVAFGVRSRFMVDQNIRAGVAYLARLMARFGGDLRLVAAAYFAGEQRVAARGLALDSREVHGYVRKVAGVYRRERVEALHKKSSEGRVSGCEFPACSAHSGCAPSALHSLPAYSSISVRGSSGARSRTDR
jgi:soluble lytic murein transglycosylase-like protein